MNIQVQEADIAHLREVLCFGIHLDESTDLSQEKCLLIYVQYMHLTELKPIQKYLGALKVLDGTAIGIVTSVVEYFERIDVDLQKLVVFTSDGAAVMLGKRGGIAELLRQQLELPHLVEFHCVAHREALAVKDAYQKNAFFLKFERQVSELISYLHTHKHISQLRSVADALEKDLFQISRILEV